MHRAANKEHCHDDIIDRSAISYFRCVNYIIMLFVCNPSNIETVHFFSLCFSTSSSYLAATCSTIDMIVHLPHFRINASKLQQNASSAFITSIIKCRIQNLRNTICFHDFNWGQKYMDIRTNSRWQCWGGGGGDLDEGVSNQEIFCRCTPRQIQIKIQI